MLAQTWRASLLCVFCTVLLASDARGAPAANVYLFDMGGRDTPVWSGFSMVTPATRYAPGRGYGWRNPSSDMRGHVANHIDALAVDDISGVRRVTMTFRVDVPNGKYTVWVLSGAMGNIWRLRYMRDPHDLLIQGQVARRVAFPEDFLFRAANYDWRKGDDPYEKFIAPRFVWYRHDAAVSDGKLLIGFRPALSFPVNAVVVAADDVAGRVAEKLKQIDRRRRDAFYQMWRESRPEPDPPAEVSMVERQRGYVVAAVHCSDDVHPWSQPSAGAGRERIDLFATPGEQEQASFAVYASRDLANARFDVSELRTAAGAVLPASAIRKGLVQFSPWPAVRRQAKLYRLKECLILPARPTFIGGGTCKRFWFTLNTPGNAAPGVYRARINITALNAPPATMDLRVRVAPVRLATPPVERFMYFGTMFFLAKAYLPRMDDKKYWESMRAEVRFMRDNQFCRAECIINHWGKWMPLKNGKVTDVDVSVTYRLMDIIREEKAWPRDNTMICRAGPLMRPLGGKWWSKRNPTITFVPEGENRENFIRAIRIINEKGKKAGWPEIAFEVGGEYTNYRKAGAKFGVEAHSAFRKAGVRNTLRGNGASDMAAIHKKLVDYPQPNWAMMKTEWFDFMKKNSRRLWAYNFARSRFSMGWFCFRHGIVRASYESGVYANGQPGNAFEIETMFPMGLPTSMKTIEPTVWLKRLAQGAVDYEYLYTLDKRIKKAEASGKSNAVTVARQARAWLNDKLDDLPSGVDYVRGDPRADRDVQGRFWPVRDLDKYRWQMAEFIMALDRATGGRAK